MTSNSNETAGPFGRSEMETIREHYRHIQRREEQQDRLRIEALRQAINAASALDLDGGVIPNAEAFYKFLSGKS